MAKIVYAQSAVDLDDYASKATVDELAAQVTALAAQVAALSEIQPGIVGLNGVGKLWAGTQAEYAAIGSPAADTVYLILDAAA